MSPGVELSRRWLLRGMAVSSFSALAGCKEEFEPQVIEMAPTPELTPKPTPDTPKPSPALKPSETPRPVTRVATKTVKPAPMETLIPTATHEVQEPRKEYHYAASIIGGVNMSASAMIPESWYSLDFKPTKGNNSMGFFLSKEWISPQARLEAFPAEGWLAVQILESSTSISLEELILRSTGNKEALQGIGGSVKQGEVISEAIGGILGKSQIFEVGYPSKGTFWIKSFAAFLERTDKILLVGYGSGNEQRKENEPALKRIAQSLQFSITPDYMISRGKPVLGINAKEVMGAEGWETYHYFTPHNDPWTPIKTALMDMVLMLPPGWQLQGDPESVGIPGFSLFGEGTKPSFPYGTGGNRTLGFGFIENQAGGISLEEYIHWELERLLTREVTTGKRRFEMAKESPIKEMITGKHRGKTKELEMALGNAPNEGDVPLWVRIFTAPLADGTNNRFVVYFQCPLGESEQGGPTFDKILQSMDVRFYSKLE